VADGEKPKLDKKFIKIIEGREFVTYGSLLQLAWAKNLTRMPKAS
jgi:hypothetical protein